eukprot:TRINITY_DN52205_c0_g1_i1.p1 TRINITY_DN52205_c0_g1~~TRINITY_DN52205_c0_g1_i1.p1  ORF type:complete len:133 (+),score=28.41 TRINITY_DN52205_c0_g1_i1:114-512(+)
MCIRDRDWTVCAPLYASGIAWTMVYDTIYAHMDKVDDAKTGVKSTALRFGKQTKPILGGFTALAGTSLVLSGVMAGQEWPFYAAAALSTAHLGRQVANAQLDKPMDCLETFKSNKWYGAIVFSGIVAGNLMQ